MKNNNTNLRLSNDEARARVLEAARAAQLHTLRTRRASLERDLRSARTTDRVKVKANRALSQVLAKLARLR